MADEWGFTGYRTDTDSEMTYPFVSPLPSPPPHEEAVRTCVALWGPDEWEEHREIQKAKAEARKAKVEARKAKRKAQAESRSIQGGADHGRVKRLAPIDALET